jgi:plastocyanin
MKISTSWRLASIAGALIGILLGATGLPAAPRPAPAAAKGAARPQVVIDHHVYTPAALVVPVGTTVTWVNRDEDPHTVTSEASLFTSSGLETDEAYSRTFTKPGTYVYFCALHPLMRAKVIVR